MAECAAAIILVNRPGVATALDLPNDATAWVTIAAVAAAMIVVASVLIGITRFR